MKKQLAVLAALGMFALPHSASADSPKAAAHVKPAAVKPYAPGYVKDRVGNRYNRKANKWDRREDIRDRKEDYRDKKEDIRDARHDGGKWDKREDRWDKREDRWDRKEDRWDRHHGAKPPYYRGHRYGHYKNDDKNKYRKYYKSPVKHYWK